MANVVGADTTKSYIVEYLIDGNVGQIQFGYGNLYTAVHTVTDDIAYNMIADEEPIAEELTGYENLDATKLTINGDGHTVKGDNRNGINIGSGKTLESNDVTFDNFTTALTVNNDGSLKLKNTTFTNNTNDVVNNGTTEFAGGVTLDDITGENGTLNVTASENANTVNETLTQNIVNVADGATLNNNGTATINKLTNDGTIDGTGTLTNKDTLVNNGTIKQDKITNEGTMTTDADKVTADNGIDNAGTLNLTGGTNTNVITGDNGTTNVTAGDVTNNGSITQKSVTVAENASLTSSTDKLTATDGVTNDGNLNLTGSEIKDKITGNGTTNINDNMKNNTSIEQGTVNIADGKSLTNDGTVTASLTNKGTFTNNADKTATINNLNNSSVVNNNGMMSTKGGENSGNIIGSGSFSNSGTLNNTGNIIQGSITNDSDGKITTNSEKMASTSGSITNNGEITFNGGRRTVNDITGDSAGNVKLDVGNDNNFVLTNKVTGNQFTLQSGTLYFGPNADVSNTASFNANGGAINVLNGKNTSTNLGKVNLNGKTNLAMDFNLKDLSSDKFIADITNNGGKFNVNNLHVTGTTLKDHIRVHLGDTSDIGRDNLSSDTFKLPTIMTPIRKISGRVEDGFVIYAPSGNNWKDFNPSVLVDPIAVQLGGYFTQLNSYEEAFRNLDMKMLMTQSERQALKMANKYASAERPQVFSPTYLPETESAGWFRPYSTFERVGLRGGPKVSNILYGSYFGGDSDMKELKHGWDFQWSLYAGYNGSHQAFQGNDIYQNGGTIGATGVWYKGNFFTALTVNVGASIAEASTMFGSEDITMIMGGIASKSGYNIELAKGKFIIQPYYMMSYSFVNAFDRHNKAGAKITSDPLNAINIAPGIKFIGNLKDGWQPYFNIQMVWNALDRTDFKAANISVPDMSIRPYVQYGIGLQRRWDERFTGYVQAMMRNGGRNGIALSLGFRWALGKGYYNNGVNKVQPEPKVIKETAQPQLNKPVANIEKPVTVVKPAVKNVSKPAQTIKKDTVKPQVTKQETKTVKPATVAKPAVKNVTKPVQTVKKDTVKPQTTKPVEKTVKPATVEKPVVKEIKQPAKTVT